jgi:dipeptidyl aminopeptidase/acylaminoacyl peptidase
MYRDDAETIVNTLGRQVINVDTASYNIQWRGNPAIELGDYLILQDKEGNANYVRWFNENTTFNGGLSSSSEWIEDVKEDLDLPPKTIASTLKSTIAKVDKVNQEISLTVETVNEYCERIDTSLDNMSQVLDEKQLEINETLKTYDSRISEVEVNTEGIELIVQSNQQTISRVDNLQYEVEELSKEVSMVVTEDEVAIMLAQEVANNGVTSVKTTTGYTFDRDGLRINKSTNALETVITENGMTVTDAGEVRLVADADGVTANKFTAESYLSIQGNIVFSEYGNDRMGCFWIKED